MTKKPRTAPRKQPSQSRSKVTVDVIIQAMTRVLIKEGYEAASTNRVAREAGVSVGSLYQYFPSKEALVLAVMEKHANELTAQFGTRMLEMLSAGPEQATRELVHVLMENHQLNPALHRVLIEQVPRVGALSKLDQMNRDYERLVALYLESHREELDIKDVNLTAFVLVTAVEAVCHTVVLSRPELLKDPRLEEHIVRLVMGYAWGNQPAVTSAPSISASKPASDRDRPPAGSRKSPPQRAEG